MCATGIVAIVVIVIKLSLTCFSLEIVALKEKQVYSSGEWIGSVIFFFALFIFQSHQCFHSRLPEVQASLLRAIAVTRLIIASQVQLM